MARNEIQYLLDKIRQKQLNNMDTSSDSKMLDDMTKEAAGHSESLSSALGLDNESIKELEDCIGNAKRFPMLDLELTIDYAEGIINLLEKEFVSDKQDIQEQKALISRIACVQWHFNAISKPLTRQYLSTTPVTTYIMISPYADVDKDMALDEVRDYKNIIESAKEVLKDKDLEKLYKVNADLMTVSTNLTQYRYCIDT